MTKQSPDSVPTAPAAPTSELASDLLPVSSTTSEPKPETKSTPAKQIVLTGEPKVTPSPEPSVTVTASPEAPPVPVLVTFPSNTQLSMGFLAGQTADDFKLMDLNGDEISLFQLLAEKPVMLQFGSYT